MERNVFLKMTLKDGIGVLAGCVLCSWRLIFMPYKVTKFVSGSTKEGGCWPYRTKVSSPTWPKTKEPWMQRSMGQGTCLSSHREDFVRQNERETTAEATRKGRKIRGGRSSEQTFNTCIFWLLGCRFPLNSEWTRRREQFFSFHFLPKKCFFSPATYASWWHKSCLKC